MEVHHHPTTPRKKSSHYFFEFFMLFLAVFCGFLAENWREHIVERKREKEFISNMIRDLESDTAELNRCIAGNLRKANNYDSLWTLLKQSDFAHHTNQLYYHFIPTTYYLPFHATKSTIRQLENSGGLRLIHNKEAANNIVSYYNEVTAAEGQLNTFTRYFDQYHEIAFTVFDYSQIDTLFYKREQLLTSQVNRTLITTDQTTVKILFNKLYALWFILNSYIGYLQELEKESTSTLVFLKKEYHLE